MGHPTLFGDSDEVRGPPDPALAGVVRELVALGVPERTAAGYGRLRAFAVLGRLRKGQAAELREARRRPAGRATGPGPDPPAADEPHGGSPAPVPVRREVAAVLSDVLGADPAVPADELYRVVRCSLYCLSRGELRRVAAGLVKMLRGPDEQAEV